MVIRVFIAPDNPKDGLDKHLTVPMHMLFGSRRSQKQPASGRNQVILPQVAFGTAGRVVDRMTQMPGQVSQGRNFRTPSKEKWDNSVHRYAHPRKMSEAA